MTVGFMIRTGPYTSQNVDTFYEIAKRLLKKGHNVKAFLYEDGVLNVNSKINPPGERNIRDRMQELIDLGAEIKLCGICAKFRGQKKSDTIESAKHAGMAFLVSLIEKSDRFLSFGF